MSEEACVATNLQSVDASTAPFVRYLTMNAVWNTQPEDIFLRLKWGIVKGVNAVSNQGTLGIPVPIGNPVIMMRIDLRDYGINVNEYENAILKLYPYATVYTDQTQVGANERFIAQQTGSKRAWLRADWFLQTIAQPPVYYDLLGLPNNTRAFLQQLGVNETADIANFTARRGGFHNSGVTNWNRLLDAHPIRVGGGAQHDTNLWRTFDVINQVDARNFFANPFGPAGSVAAVVHVFQFDASEWIFGLPNGLDGYFLSNSQDVRIDEAITTIATDRANNSPFIGSAPFVVRNGVSCMHCHSSSMNTFTDQIRASSQGNASFSQVEINIINQLFANPSQMNSIIDKHATNFTTAINTLFPANRASVLANETEPVFWSSKWYALNLDINQAASELGLPPQDFVSCLLHSPNLASVLGVGDPVNGVIARAEWEQNVNQAMLQCDIGVQQKF